MSKDHAIEQALESFEKIQLEEKNVLTLLEIFSEWKPSGLLLKKIYLTYPEVKISYAFEDGDEEKFMNSINNF